MPCCLPAASSISRFVGVFAVCPEMVSAKRKPFRTSERIFGARNVSFRINAERNRAQSGRDRRLIGRNRFGPFRGGGGGGGALALTAPNGNRNKWPQIIAAALRRPPQLRCTGSERGTRFDSRRDNEFFCERASPDLNLPGCAAARSTSAAPMWALSNRHRRA